VAEQTAQKLHRSFEDAFNARDIDGLMALYEPACALVPEPGVIALGQSQVREALAGLLALDGMIRLETRDVVEVQELAYLSCAWTLAGTGSDGSALDIGGVTAEVARRQPDGRWLYVIDLPVAAPRQ